MQRVSVMSMLAVLVALWLGLAAASCNDEASALSRLGGSCSLNSDCDDALSCVFGVCHEACASSKDCVGGRCVFDANKVRVCQNDSQASCGFNSQCPANLICGIDGKCRNECAADRDCIEGQICTTATCADPSETQNGQLPPAGDAALGMPCNYSSQCPKTKDGLTLECSGGRCGYACFEERDCARFYSCTTAESPDTPGDCVLIGKPGALYCDPDEDPPEGNPCSCFGGVTGVQFCKSNGSGYDECVCN